MPTRTHEGHTSASRNIEFLNSLGISYGQLAFTTNGVNHNNFDASEAFRSFLLEHEIHDYEHQEFGGVSNKVTFPATYIDDDATQSEVKVNLYRAKTRGDRRLSVTPSGATNFLEGQVAFVWLSGRFIVFSLDFTTVDTLRKLLGDVISRPKDGQERKPATERPRGGQGWKPPEPKYPDLDVELETELNMFAANPADRKAIERLAVRRVTLFLETEGYEVKDVGNDASYDLDAQRENEHLYVEVKGTQTNGQQVILTPNEVELHRREYPHTMLAVVSGIALNYVDGAPVATEGVLNVIHPWQIDQENLALLSYSYRLPQR